MFIHVVEQFERGAGFRITKRISDPPRAEDFAALSISDEDVVRRIERFHRPRESRSSQE